MFWTIVGITYW